MAKDAIEAVKAAEEEARAILNEATRVSKSSLLETEQLGEVEYKKIISSAEEQAKEIRNKAVQEGEAIAQPIIEKGNKEAKALYEIDDKALESSINIIVERIVNANGNS